MFDTQLFLQAQLEHQRQKISQLQGEIVARGYDRT